MVYREVGKYIKLLSTPLQGVLATTKELQGRNKGEGSGEILHFRLDHCHGFIFEKGWITPPPPLTPLKRWGRDPEGWRGGGWFQRLPSGRPTSIKLFR